MAGEASSRRKPIDINLRPHSSTGMMRFSSVAEGRSREPNMREMLGPYRSQSQRPVAAPCIWRATARFAATVDFPTPPLPLAMAMTCLTPGMDTAPTPAACAGAWMSRTTRMLPTPGSPPSAASLCSLMALGTSGSLVASAIRTATSAPCMSMAFTSPKETMSLLKPGYFTAASRSRIASSVICMIRSIAFPHIARQDIQFVPILGDRAPGDGYAARAQDFDDLLVAQRVLGVLFLDQVFDRALDARVAHRLAPRGLVAGREEILHLEDSLRRGDVLAGDGAADRRLMHADDLGDLHHRHRLEGDGASFEELLLPRDDLVRDVRDGLLPLVDALDEEFAAADFVADVVLHVVAVAFLGHQVLVGVADAEVGYLVAVEGDGEVVADFLDVHIRQDVVVRVGGEYLARLRVEGGDEVRAPLHLLDGGAEAAGDLREAPFAEVVEVVGDDAVFQRVLLAHATELDEETVPQIPRADADGMKSLDDPEYPVEVAGVGAAVQRHILGRRLEEPDVVDVPYDQLGELAVVRREIAPLELLDEMLLQGLVADDRVEKELAAFLLLLRTAGVGVVRSE